MPRQRINYRRRTYDFSEDFPRRLERFKEESGLPWAELARRLDTDSETVRRWRKGEVRPSTRHMLALLHMAGELHLGHLFTD